MLGHGTVLGRCGTNVFLLLDFFLLYVCFWAAAEFHFVLHSWAAVEFLLLCARGLLWNFILLCALGLLRNYFLLCARGRLCNFILLCGLGLLCNCFLLCALDYYGISFCCGTVGLLLRIFFFISWAAAEFLSVVHSWAIAAAESFCVVKALRRVWGMT